MTLSASTLAAYLTTTSTLGFGLHSAARLLAAGLSWGQIHELTSAGVVKVHTVHAALNGNAAVIYRLFFP